jgi:hypothetical protein
LTAYAKFAAQPNPTAIAEIKDDLKDSTGFAPNPLGNFMSEYMHF